MNDKKDILSQATEAIASEKVSREVPEVVVKATMARLAEAGAGERRTDSISVLERIKLMKSYTKFSIAAVLVIGFLFGVNYFGGSIDGSGVVFAKVLDQVKQVQNVAYKVDSTVDGEFFEDMPEESRSTEMEMFFFGER